MKLVKEHINEKFTLDSDPIKDLGIGKINFRDEFDKQYFEPSIKLFRKWEKYVDQFRGKTICGIFNVYDFRGDYSGKKGYAEVEFTSITLDREGTMNLETPDHSTYCILDSESYIIK
jgi:hypothetical protein